MTASSAEIFILTGFIVLDVGMIIYIVWSLFYKKFINWKKDSNKENEYFAHISFLVNLDINEIIRLNKIDIIKLFLDKIYNDMTNDDKIVFDYINNDIYIWLNRSTYIEIPQNKKYSIKITFIPKSYDYSSDYCYLNDFINKTRYKNIPEILSLVCKINDRIKELRTQLSLNHLSQI